MERTLRPIPVNPGGAVAIEHILGRDRMCDLILETLETRSVVLTGERRMGKTSLARLVEHAAQERGWVVVRHSAEGYERLGDLAEALTRRFERLDGPLRKAARVVRERTKVRVPAAGVEVDLSGRPAFEDVVEAAVEAADGRLLLILDELPLFARALDVSSGERREGTAALHLLRRLREAHAGLRMLCLGSVGFHHVVRGASGVLNDTRRVRLEPLAPEDAAFLARCLLRGARLAADDEPATADAMARAVEGVPFYIHKLVEAAEVDPNTRPLDPARVDGIVDGALAAPDDPWDLRHYRNRVGLYYGEDASLARGILDAVAATRQPVDLAAIVRRLDTEPSLAPVDPDRVHDVLERLEDDHYLVRSGEQRAFAFVLVRRAWIELRR